MSRALPVPMLNTPRTGRSTLLRAGAVSPVRRRAYALRRLIVAALLAFAGFLILAMSREIFPVSGPFVLLYWLHDAVWLPIYGRVWLAAFPGGLVWLAPLAVLGAAVLAEFLGLAAPIRWLQVRSMSSMLNGPWWRLVLAWHRLLGAIGRRALLAEAILREDQYAARATAEEAVEQGRNPALAVVRLAEVQLRILSFGLLEAREALTILETLALARLTGVGKDAAIVSLRKQAARACIPVCPDWEALLAMVEAAAPPAEVLRLAARMRDPELPEAELAARSIGIALGAIRDGRSEHMVWFDEWARLRAGGNPELSQRLGLAEGAISFEFWAGQAEAAVSAEPLVPMLQGAFAALSPVRPRGERFARTGAERKA